MLLQLLGQLIPVGLHVLFTVQRGLERLLAVGAHVGAQVVVDAHVAPQAAASGEGAVADETLEGLEAGVGAHMCLEHARGDKASPTLGALEGLLARVRSDVLF